MRASADVVVAGAGPAGLAVALALAGRGLGTLVLDPGTPARSALWPGLFAPQGAEPGPGPQRELALLSGSLLEAWVEGIEEESGLSCELDVRGTVAVARTDAEEVDLDRALDWQRGRGLAFEVLQAGDAAALEPSLGEEVLAAFHFPRDGAVHPGRLLPALRVAARAAGVEILEGVVPLGLGPGAEGEGWVVGTAAGLFPAAAVVDAGGLPHGSVADLPLPVSFRATVVLLDASSDPDRPTRPLLGGGVRLVPRRDGTLLVSASAERASADPRPTASSLSDLLDRAGRLVPASRDYPVLESGAIHGSRPKDGLPVLGECSRPGLFAALGFGIEELELAPAAGAVLAAFLSGERPTIDANPFSPERFRA